MSNSLSSDFQAFIDNRLDCADEILKESTDYRRQTGNIESATKELLSAMSPELSTTLGDIDDSYAELLNISQRVSYRQGFKDALRLIAEI